jgi:hypothetical protein
MSKEAKAIDAVVPELKHENGCTCDSQICDRCIVDNAWNVHAVMSSKKLRSFRSKVDLILGDKTEIVKRLEAADNLLQRLRAMTNDKEEDGSYE